MAFKMNKPVIKGTTGHSALLAKAEEMARTHGGDPTLGTAATAYGESMSSPDVIDYRIKSREIEFDKKEKEEKTEKETTTTTNTTNDVIARKIEVANDDSEAADARLRSEREAVEEHVRTTPGDILDIKHEPYKYPDTEVDLETLMEKEQDDPDDIPKKKPRATTTGPVAQSVGGVSTQNLKTSYTKEEQERLIFSDEHARMVLPEEIGIKPDVIIESKKLDKKIKKATKKSQRKQDKKVESTTTTKPTVRRNGALEVKYKNSSDWEQKQMRKKNPNYPWSK